MTNSEHTPPKTNPELIPANLSTPPDGFEPERDGAATWLAMRMKHANPDDA
ncbi:MAG: hypothetical protein AAFP68_04635 [Pseudomonadota bacterium]